MSSGTAALSMAQAVAFPARTPASPQGRWQGWQEWLDSVDLAPDLGTDIGSRHWWRGLGTLAALCTAATLTFPGFRAIPGESPPAFDESDFDEARAQIITPIAYGSDTGRRMAATDAVRPLAQTPERPQIELTATLGRGDSFARVLERAGVGSSDAGAIARQLTGTVALGDIAPGTRIDLVLGRRPQRTMPRPVDALAMRARFDLRVEMERIDGRLVLRRIPIAVDDTPLRIRGKVGARGGGATLGNSGLPADHQPADCGG
jgi:hypothetical protein